MALQIRWNWSSLIACICRRERQVTITPPFSSKRECSAFYDHRNNVIVGLPESWGTWRRPIVVTESLEGISLEPVSAITEDISIGTMSIYSLYQESATSERSPLLSTFIPAAYSPGQRSTDTRREKGSPPLISTTEHLSVLAHQETTNSPVESEAANPDRANPNEPNDSQLLTVPPRWGSTSIELTPRHLLPRRSARPRGYPLKSMYFYPVLVTTANNALSGCLVSEFVKPSCWILVYLWPQGKSESG